MKKRTTHAYIVLVVSVIFLSASIGATLYLLRQTSRMQIDLIDSEKGEVATHVGRNKEMYDTLEAFWVNKDEAPQFVALVERSAQSVGVELEIMSLRYERVQENEFLVADLTFAGSWESVMRYLQGLSSLPFEKSLENVQVASLQDENLWRGTVILKVHVYEK